MADRKVPKSEKATSPKPKRADVEALARRMWTAYRDAQGSAEQVYYAEWCDLTEGDTRRGFRAVARMVLKEMNR